MVMTETDEKKLERRQFLARIGKAGISIAAAGVVSSLLYDGKGPTAAGRGEKVVTLPDFSVKGQAGQIISVVKGVDRTQTVNKAIELLGGIERFVKPGEIVAIKPNAAFASPAMLGATTNPDLAAAVIKLCYKAGAKDVIVIDNPINDPASCFEISGIGRAAAGAGGRVVLPKESLFQNTSVKGGKLIKDWPVLVSPLEKVNKLIGIAPVKNHSRSGASMTMKNWYGLLGGRRNVFHQDINNIITELAMMVKPTLVILDGTETMMTNGPTGGAREDLKRTNTMIVSCDQVAADSYGCSLLNLKPADLPYLAMAQNAGIGTADYESLKPILAALG